MITESTLGDYTSMSLFVNINCYKHTILEIHIKILVSVLFSSPLGISVNE